MSTTSTEPTAELSLLGELARLGLEPAAAALGFTPYALQAYADEAEAIHARTLELAQCLRQVTSGAPLPAVMLPLRRPRGLSRERAVVLVWLRAHPGSSATAVARGLGHPFNNVRARLRTAHEVGLLCRVSGLWSLSDAGASLAAQL